MSATFTLVQMAPNMGFLWFLRIVWRCYNLSAPSHVRYQWFYQAFLLKQCQVL